MLALDTEKESAPSNLQNSDDLLENLRQKRRELNRTKRQLETKGFDDFVKTGDESKLDQAEQIKTQIRAVNTQIEFIEQSGNLITTYKLESNYAKREFVADVNSYGKEK